MSVIIKGMEMPTVCITEDGWLGNCPMDRTWCQQRFAPPETTAGEAYKARLGKLPEWCPLVPVPSHGRLTDADKLTERLDGIWDCNDMVFEDDNICGRIHADCNSCRWRETRDYIRDHVIKPAPTIIDAEEGK